MIQDRLDAMRESYRNLYAAWLKSKHDAEDLRAALEPIIAHWGVVNALGSRGSLGSLLDAADAAIAESKRGAPDA